MRHTLYSTIISLLIGVSSFYVYNTQIKYQPKYEAGQCLIDSLGLSVLTITSIEKNGYRLKGFIFLIPIDEVRSFEEIDNESKLKETPCDEIF